MDTKQINDAIGRKALQDALCLSDSSIREAYRANRFPASWYPIVERECHARGIHCPRDVFAWKAAAE